MLRLNGLVEWEPGRLATARLLAELEMQPKETEPAVLD